MKNLTIVFYCIFIASIQSFAFSEAKATVTEVFKAEAEVYPNPTEDYITIKLSKMTDQPITLKMYSIIGNTVYVTNLKEVKTVIDLRSFSSGYYWITLKEPVSGFSKTIKILKI